MFISMVLYNHAYITVAQDNPREAIMRLGQDVGDDLFVVFETFKKLFHSWEPTYNKAFISEMRRLKILEDKPNNHIKNPPPLQNTNRNIYLYTFPEYSKGYPNVSNPISPGVEQ